MNQFPSTALLNGVDVDFLFDSRMPTFGDLFQICGHDHPAFPVSGSFNFAKLAGFGFEQVDDYFGIKSVSDVGDDVVIWLYPLIDNQPVDHHPGPFQGIRLSFNVLRNPAQAIDLFIKVVSSFAHELPAKVVYRPRQLDISHPSDISMLEGDLNRIADYWRAKAIEPGSSEALRLEN